MRDGVILNVFVRHEALDADGNMLPDDGQYFPGEKDKKSNGGSPDHADPGLNYSSDTSEENIDYNNDAEEAKKVHTHVFTIDMVARYPD